jgi:hypothetical protein
MTENASPVSEDMLEEEFETIGDYHRMAGSKDLIVSERFKNHR